jgi:hypothetical protein
MQTYAEVKDDRKRGCPVTIPSDSIPRQSRLPRAPPDGTRIDERLERGVSYNEQKVHN